MTSLIFSPRTEAALASLKENLPHALLLTGLSGAGLYTTARMLTDKKLEMTIMPTDREGNVDSSPKGIIRAKQIRRLIEHAVKKTSNQRYYIVDDADQMNHTAQNAFLKLLEEPPEHVSFILTSHTPHKLLPTILSRVQRITLDPISSVQSQALLSAHDVTSERDQSQMLFLAQGLPATLTRLALDQQYFQAASTSIRDARTLLQGDAVTRIQLIESYQKDRAQTLALLQSAQRIVRHSLSTQPSSDIITTADRLATAYDRIAANGNIRLQLMGFIV